ncbi:IlvGEDA operon leader peptide [Xenorhabdus szentirmaii]|uniref:ilv operon leader peptide n=1 Tax=Xenorhabdus szentirmaii TaxID=290112 RepID=A0AAW3YRA7_9GAMM|nr:MULTISPECIES: IlvGEDA operon leader peptide [Xenorhabdus]MBD2780731.1 IlvGEDA operon leader peptide [Xenorhabdus sp. 38]MBD2791901.1 IlvGEDA operon leader peptide [Xenorhabdus sp. CUL]MBD2800600.1 IlvGEDA operon leader peptide [Xenorhabdus sp. M]MBD2803811.1 IlvGEDA operon leader peptide [Xenorhabdus sp. ZM]MBD2819647.1 IlvGEDA operon leader peptide [Xenorhabdus sp. 42]
MNTLVLVISLIISVVVIIPPCGAALGRKKA